MRLTQINNSKQTEKNMRYC